MVGPPEERMTWGENSPKALWAYRRVNGITEAAKRIIELLYLGDKSLTKGTKIMNEKRKTNTLMKTTTARRQATAPGI